VTRILTETLVRPPRVFIVGISLSLTTLCFIVVYYFFFFVFR
jgi:hypothetical protein